MNYEQIETPNLKASECLVVGLFPDEPLPEFAQALDKQYNNTISRLALKLKEEGAVLWQSDLDDHRLMLTHCGQKNNYNADKLKKRSLEIAEQILKHDLKSAVVALPLLKDMKPDWQLEQMILAIENARYQLLDFKSEKKEANQLEKVSFYVPNAHKETIPLAKSVGAGVHLARTLANLPGNVCTPSYLAEQAQTLAKELNSIAVKIIDKEQMEAFGMGGLLGVAQGSHQPPKLIEMQYMGGASGDKPIILVGKGITFDAGGISLKPAENMHEMKYDMGGAASVFGALKACALLKLPINVIGLVASAENMPGGGALKPGDIIKTMAGKTVEITNTDAEGRLVLADALTYAERFNPQFVIDVATLTGAMIISLGNDITGFMTTDDDLANIINQAADESMDKAWRLPLEESFQKALESPIADMVNAAPGRAAGSITAACFLSRFTESFRWAHLDIAGTAWVSGKSNHATGRPVPLLTQILRHAARSR